MLLPCHQLFPYTLIAYCWCYYTQKFPIYNLELHWCQYTQLGLGINHLRGPHLNYLSRISWWSILHPLVDFWEKCPRYIFNSYQSTWERWYHSTQNHKPNILLSLVPLFYYPCTFNPVAMHCLYLINSLTWVRIPERMRLWNMKTLFSNWSKMWFLLLAISRWWYQLAWLRTTTLKTYWCCIRNRMGAEKFYELIRQWLSFLGPEISYFSLI